jgi:hypothetical protein
MSAYSHRITYHRAEFVITETVSGQAGAIAKTPLRTGGMARKWAGTAREHMPRESVPGACHDDDWFHAAGCRR